MIKGISDIGDYPESALYHNYAIQISAAFVYKSLYLTTAED